MYAHLWDNVEHPRLHFLLSDDTVKLALQQPALLLRLAGGDCTVQYRVQCSSTDLAVSSTDLAMSSTDLAMSSTDLAMSSTNLAMSRLSHEIVLLMAKSVLL